MQPLYFPLWEEVWPTIAYNLVQLNTRKIKKKICHLSTLPFELLELCENLYSLKSLNDRFNIINIWQLLLKSTGLLKFQLLLLFFYSQCTSMFSSLTEQEHLLCGSSSTNKTVC